MAKVNDSVFVTLLRAAAAAQKVAAQLLFECGVTPFEQWLLEAIPDEGNACASELAARLDVPTSTVTRALRRLERQEWVTLRKGLFMDARVLRAQLTPAGRSIRAGGLGFEDDVDRVITRGMPPDILIPLLRGLVHMAEGPPRARAGGQGGE